MNQRYDTSSLVNVFKMGSAPSTPSQEHSNDPWWPIERQNLALNPNESNNSINNNIGDNISSAMDAHETARSPALASESDTNQSEGNSSSDQSNENASEITVGENEVETHEEVDEVPRRPSKPDQTLEEFKEELRIKREKRQTAIAELRSEITSLRDQLAEEKAMNQRLIAEKCGSDSLDATEASQYLEVALQEANREISVLNQELAATKVQVTALKQAVKMSKEMVEIRETQLTQVGDARRLAYAKSAFSLVTTLDDMFYYAPRSYCVFCSDLLSFSRFAAESEASADRKLPGRPRGAADGGESAEGVRSPAEQHPQPPRALRGAV